MKNSTPQQKVKKLITDWGPTLPFIVAVLVGVLFLFLRTDNIVAVFADEAERDLIFKRLNVPFDSTRAYVIVSDTCINSSEEAFFFSRNPSFSAGDVGNPMLPVWGDLAPGTPPTECGTFLRELKAHDVPFKLLLATDGGLGETLANAIRKRTAGFKPPAVIVGIRLVEGTPAAINKALDAP